MTDLRTAAQKEQSNPQFTKQHMTHCFQGEHPNSCAYGPNEKCPARIPDQCREAAQALQRLMHLADDYATSTSGEPDCTHPERNALLDALSDALAQPQTARLAGWFTEIPSAMSYRLWEQGGHEAEPGYVALYELGEPVQQDHIPDAGNMVPAMPIGAVLTYRQQPVGGVCGNTIGADGAGDKAVVFYGTFEQARIDLKRYFAEPWMQRARSVVIVYADEGWSGCPLTIVRHNAGREPQTTENK